ncbi:filamentous hemagglutinin N-terminal domain-containing protein [Phormidium tenue]|uniref:Filamentous haemagglutinin FhaB/tRNA nuclease CdiA-like TPS domain-containing protein n=1 Tax=Phormidium tenue NIES-30 TaxID=549789 RepID=A0A1U7IYA9_9CYAN|nr:filamentous hemagglutinin N-terminal domain-containing protein [Phormidium tenue]MBD2234790.1 filamentous hemagglutinin N-terminal domain-containing protein [Phormidium tenue FACHB-1052]OKH43518.1 hypothetical protein NIES30_24655 [Phormidium tenue NIES-30]
MRYSTLPVCGMLVLGAIATLTATSPTLAQLVPDATLGTESSTVTPDAPVQGGFAELIGGGAVQEGNLFHSFLEFNVDAGQRVYFANPAGVEAIFSRVTGGSPSNIFGTLGVDGTADLFLMNPNGLVFGPGARLDVQGAFTATTASAIQFGEQGSFGAADPNPLPILTVDPSALWFNQLSRGSITSQGILFVDGGQSLILAGGNIVLDNSILDVDLSAGGRIELGAVAGEGTVQLAKDDSLLRLTFPGGLERADIIIKNSGIDVSANGGGSIAITGRNVNTSGSTILAGIASGVGNEQSQAGDINLDAAETLRVEANSIIANQITPGGIGNAGTVNISANNFIADQSNISGIAFGPGNAGDINILVDRDIALNASNVFSLGIESLAANAGNVNIKTTNLSLSNGAQISASSFGIGTTGNVVVNARDRVSLDGFPSAIFSSIFGSSQNIGGDIRITARELSLTNSAKLDTSVNGQGSGGNVIIDVQDGFIIDGIIEGRPGSSIFSTIEEQGTGTAGDVRINAGFVALTNSGTIQSLTRGQGNAGNIFIQARDFVSLDGFASRGTTIVPGIDEPVFVIIPSAIASVVTNNGNASGNAGDIYIQAGNYISLSDTASITSSIESEIAIGNAGNVTLEAGSFFANNGNIGTTTVAQGDAGDITINTRDRVDVDNLSRLQSFTDGLGDAGNIKIVSQGIVSFNNGAQIQAGTFRNGNAGNIEIDAVTTVSLNSGILFQNDEFFPSAFLSTVDTTSTGEGGNISVRAGALSVTEGAVISATTVGRGPAGNIQVEARDRLLIDGYSAQSGFPSRLQTSTEFPTSGPSGDIDLSARQVQVLNGGQVLANSEGRSSAGTVRVNATDSILVSGSNPTFAAQAANRPSIARLFIPQSTISVRSSAAGAAGNLIIGDLGNTPRLVLDQGGQLIAESAAVNGGNIVIDLSQVLLLRNGSLISATAGTAQAGGNGGNITIRAPFIVAIPSENSDIRADAFAGAGGNVSIAARGIFGIEPRLDRSPLSDITATSELGVSGVVAVETLDTSFIEGSLTPLEDALVDTAALTSGSCIARTGPGLGAFTVTGGGGLPLSPGDGAISAYPTGTVRTVEESTASAIQEPDGVYQLPDGRLVLSRRCADRSAPRG